MKDTKHMKDTPRIETLRFPELRNTKGGTKDATVSDGTSGGSGGGPNTPSTSCICVCAKRP